MEQVIADLKGSALKHFPSGSFNANGAWLACAVIAHNLARAAGVLAGGKLRKARTGTIRTKLINIPARVSYSARSFTLHLPANSRSQDRFMTMFDAIHPPPNAASPADHPPPQARPSTTPPDNPMTDRAIPATPKPPAPVQDQLPDFKINRRRRGGSRR